MSTDTIIVNGFQNLADVYEEITTEWRDATWYTLLDDMKQHFYDAHKEYFENQTDPSGAPWQPLAESTIRRKGHSRILFEKGRLMDSLTKSGGDNIVETYSETGQHGISFGTSVEYAGYHQEGTDTIPQREHVGTNDDDLDELCDWVADEAVRILQGHGHF